MTQAGDIESSQERLALGPFLIEASSPTISGPEGRQKLSPLAVRLLFRLAQDAPSPVYRADLIADLWDGNDLVGEPALNRLVSEVRAAASLVADRPLIVTVPRVGYRLAEQAHGAGQRETARSRSLWPLTIGFVLIVAILAAAWVTTVHIYQRPATMWQDLARSDD